MSVKVTIVARSKDASGLLKLVSETPLGSTYADEAAAQSAIKEHLHEKPLDPPGKRAQWRTYRIESA